MPARNGFKSIYARQSIRIYPVQFFAEDERSGFNWDFSVFNDNALEPFTPKIATPVMPFIVVSGKADLYFPDKFRKIG